MSIFSSKRGKLLALAVVTGLALVPVVGFKAHAGFGPNRNTFTWANPATYITFNSITDNPTQGDERTFYKAYTANDPTRVDPAPVTDNQEVILQVYFHNNAASNLNLVAHNTQVKFVLPTNSGTSLSSTAYISADNANPTVVSDTLDFNSASPFTVAYEPGTARLWTNTVNGATLSDNVVTTGTLIGSNGADGNVPGCSEFSGFVTIKVRVHVQAPQPNFACSGLDVAEVDQNRFNVTAHTTVQNATVQSYTFTTKNGAGAVIDTKTVTTNALSATYAFNQTNPDTYTVSAVVNTDKGSTNPSTCTKQITVSKSPVFACTGLTATVGSNRVVNVSVGVQADNGATLSSVNYDFGDGNTLMSSATSTSHTYAKDGTYTIAATLTFNVGSTNQTARCSQTVTITTPTTPQVLSTTTTLPNTGPGDDAAAIFGGVTAIGAAGHYALALRRNRR